MNETTTSLHHDLRGVPSLWEATLEVFETGQQVIIDRIELVRAEISEDLLRLTVGASFVVSAGVLALVGYLTLLAAGVVLLARFLPPEAALAIAGGVHLLLGAGLAALGLASLRRMQLSIPSGGGDEHVRTARGGVHG